MQNIVEGHTDPITDQLLLDGVATESLAGHTVECVLWTSLGVLKTGMGTSSIVNAATRTVKFVPNAGTLLASESPYMQRWKITRPITGEVYYHPSASAERWKVFKP